MRRTRVSAVVLGTAMAMGLSLQCFAPPKDEPLPPPKKEQQQKQAFQGKIEAVDPSAKTLMVEGKTIYVTADTKITKDGQSIKLTDLKVGEEVHGTSRQTFDGKMEALTVKVGRQDKDADKS